MIAVTAFVIIIQANAIIYAQVYTSPIGTSHGMAIKRNTNQELLEEKTMARRTS